MDSHAAHELELYAENDYAVYQQLKAINANQLKHIARGKWNFVQSIKGFRHAVDTAARKYDKEFGGSSFPGPVRNEVARRFARAFAQENGIPTKHLVG